MKRIILIAAMVAFGWTAQAQQEQAFSVGLHPGLPIGDASDFSSFALTVDASYLFDIADSFSLGPLVGYQHFFGKDNFDDGQFLPLAGQFRFWLDELFFGADLGYALGLNDGNDGGFFYRPKVGYSIADMVSLLLSYNGVIISGSDGADDITVSSLNVGVEFRF